MRFPQVRFSTIAILAICFLTWSSPAQFGGPGFGAPPKGADLSGPMTKLFGNHPGFSATMEIQTSLPGTGEKMITPAKVAFLEGKSRIEFDMTQPRGSPLPPKAAAQMKSLGMDRMMVITRPDKKLQYSVLPSFKAYAEMPLTNHEAAKSRDDFTLEATPLTRETVDGHDCMKNKAAITDNEGSRSELIVWNAMDLDKFPVKIERPDNGALSTILFKDIKLTKPDPIVFEPPAEMTKYSSLREMMQVEMTKKYKESQGQSK